MTRHKKTLPVLAATLTLAFVQLVGTAPAASAATQAFAVIGDVPYGSTQYSQFAGYVDKINADPDVQLVSHLGDISSPLNCSTSYYDSIKSAFNRFADPLIYSPGDNEWSDCSRAAIGAGDPLAKLAAVRSVFFPRPGTSLGASTIPVTAQSGYPENVRFNRLGLTFAAVHAVGSNNDLKVWSGNTSVTNAQRAEFNARVAADDRLITDTFAQAKSSGSRAVVLIMQADMFNTKLQNATYKSAFQSIVQTIASESASFGKPVFLVNGDTHGYVSDKPLASSTWTSYYGVPSVGNLSRVTIKGGTSEWTKFTIVSGPAVLQWTRVPS